MSAPQRSAAPPLACTHSNVSLGLGVMPNIIGLGIDATDIGRIAQTIERYGDRFVHRIFTEGEVAYVDGDASQRFILPAGSPRRKPR